MSSLQSMNQPPKYSGLVLCSCVFSALTCNLSIHQVEAPTLFTPQSVAGCWERWTKNSVRSVCRSVGTGYPNTLIATALRSTAVKTPGHAGLESSILTRLWLPDGRYWGRGGTAESPFIVKTRHNEIWRSVTERQAVLWLRWCFDGTGVRSHQTKTLLYFGSTTKEDSDLCVFLFFWA